jgi:hypothetical protein
MRAGVRSARLRKATNASIAGFASSSVRASIKPRKIVATSSAASGTVERARALASNSALRRPGSIALARARSTNLANCRPLPAFSRLGSSASKLFAISRSLPPLSRASNAPFTFCQSPASAESSTKRSAASTRFASPSSAFS